MFENGSLAGVEYGNRKAAKRQHLSVAVGLAHAKHWRAQ